MELVKRFKKYNPNVDTQNVDWGAYVQSNDYQKNIKALQEGYPQYDWGTKKEYNTTEINEEVKYNEYAEKEGQYRAAHPTSKGASLSLVYEKGIDEEKVKRKAIDMEKRAEQKKVREAAKQQIEAAREENKPTPYIQAEIEQLARDNGLTYDELIKEWNGKFNAEDNYELLKQKVAFKKGEISSYDVDELENSLKEQGEKSITNYSESPENITYESQEESPKMKASTSEKQEESEEQKRAKQEEKERKEQDREEQRKRDYDTLMADLRKYSESFNKEEKTGKAEKPINEKPTESSLESEEQRRAAEELPKPSASGEDTEKMYRVLEKKRLGKKYNETILKQQKFGKQLGIPSKRHWKSPEQLKQERETLERNAVLGDTSKESAFGRKQKSAIYTEHIESKPLLTPKEMGEIKKKKEQETVKQRYEAIQAEKRAEEYEKELEGKAKYGRAYVPVKAATGAYGFIKGQKYRSGKSLKDLLGEVTSKIKVSGRSSNRRSNW